MTARKKVATPKIDPAILRAIEATAEKAAKRAVTRAMKQFMLQLGTNAITPEGIKESQQDAAFLHRMRVSAESAPGKLGLAALGALLSLVGGVILFFFKKYFDQHFN
ncbi:hypothetical protein [Bradyrhizobium sp. 153]|uniref:hypothetical protein n=1 Tax=Bradyrhizobium sp. 153 TaxID=2782627 RepID=UPI001FF789D9|nr:hypothetical protein [Bradyrhizobium sp. 153]MCK1668611.1 hypothetical protein [Bradyrhizobium sp. 153]